MDSEPRGCPVCSGWGTNRTGGPCKHCDGRGWVTGAQKVSANLNAIGGAITQIVYAGFALAVIIVIFVAILK